MPQKLIEVSGEVCDALTNENKNCKRVNCIMLDIDRKKENMYLFRWNN